MNIHPAKIEARIMSETKALLPVHFAGRPCEMDALRDIAECHGLKIIEDCAHAIETEYKRRKAGTFGDFGCFSFYVTKNVITGEGGMVLARAEADAARIKVLAPHGMSKDAWKRFGDEGYKHYQVVECGYKYNMTDLQAAIGIHQLRRVEPNWRRRELKLIGLRLQGLGRVLWRSLACVLVMMAVLAAKAVLSALPMVWQLSLLIFSGAISYGLVSFYLNRALIGRASA